MELQLWRLGSNRSSDAMKAMTLPLGLATLGRTQQRLMEAETAKKNRAVLQGRSALEMRWFEQVQANLGIEKSQYSRC